MPPECTTCGSPLPSNLAHCPRCLLALALGRSNLADSGAPRAHRTPRTPESLAPLFPEFADFTLLGTGGMGAVYRATHTRLNRPVAIKILHADLAASPDFTARFHREAQTLARLSHPSIVTLHDFGERASVLYLVMEHVPGTNLRALLRANKLEPQQALSIAHALCTALEYAHSEGIVHRDIKPENVLIDAKGRIKIADFGLAKLHDDRSPAITHTGQAMGTPHYMAPEQLERPHDVDHRADLYSLGVVLYEMLTGVLPLGRYQPPSRRANTDAQVDSVVERALEREPDRRYPDAAAMRTDVERASSTALPAAVRAPAAPATAATLPSALSVPAPRHWKGAVGSFLLFALAWVFSAHAFNSGLWPLVGAGALLALVFFSVFSWRLRASPELVTRLARLSPIERAGRLACGVLAFALAFLLLVHALQSNWLLGTPHWQPVYEGLERWSPSTTTAGVAPHTRLPLTTFPRLGFSLLARPEAAFLAALLALVASLGCCAATSTNWRTWRGFWRPVLATIGLYAGALVAGLLAVAIAAAARTPDAERSVHVTSYSTNATVEEITPAVQEVLGRHGWRLSTWMPLVQLERSTNAYNSLGYLYEARPAEWIGSIRLRPDGPLCVRPTLRVVVWGEPGADTRQIVVHAGVTEGHAEQAKLAARERDDFLRQVQARLPK